MELKRATVLLVDDEEPLAGSQCVSLNEPPPNHAEGQDPNVMTIYFVRAQEAGNEIRSGKD